MTSRRRSAYPAAAELSSGISKISKITEEKQVSLPAIPDFEFVERLGVLHMLERLEHARNAIDTRSHEHLRLLAIGAYAVADKLSESAEDWENFCKDPFWEGVRQRPRLNRPETALRHALIRVFGKGDVRASQWKSRMEDDFRRRRPSQLVYEGLQRNDRGRSPSRPKTNGLKRERIELSIKPSKNFTRTHKLGLFESGEKMSISVDMVDGACALIDLTIRYAESRTKPTSFGALRARKLFKELESKAVVDRAKRSDSLK